MERVMSAVRLARWQAEPELVRRTERFTLDQAVDAYRRLRRGEVHGRAVVTPELSTELN